MLSIDLEWRRASTLVFFRDPWTNVSPIEMGRFHSGVINVCIFVGRRYLRYLPDEDFIFEVDFRYNINTNIKGEHLASFVAISVLSNAILVSF